MSREGRRMQARFRTWGRRCALALVLLVAGCAVDGRQDDAGQHACTEVVPAADTSAVPAPLDLESFATITEIVRDRGFVNATAMARGTVAGIQQRFSRDLRQAGYSIVGSENEVVEADVFFARGTSTTGAAKFIQTSCEGRVRIQLFLGESRA